MHGNPAGQATDRVRFDQFAVWYAVHRLRRSGMAPARSTITTRTTHLAVCARITGCQEEAELGTLLQDRDRVEHLLDALAARMTPGAMRAYAYSLMAFAEFAKATGVATYSALQRSDIPPVNPPPAITVYSGEDLEAFISAARGVELRWWALLTALVDTGRRIGELLNLRWEWLRLHDSPAYFELPTNKTHRPQYVPLTKRLTEQVLTPVHIERLATEVREGRRAFHRSAAEYVFPWTYSTVYKRFSAFCDRTGLPNRGLHNFRHTVITARLARGVPIQAVAALAGHSSISTTARRYDHTTALTFARFVECD